MNQIYLIVLIYMQHYAYGTKFVFQYFIFIFQPLAIMDYVTLGCHSTYNSLDVSSRIFPDTRKFKTRKHLAHIFVLF